MTAHLVRLLVQTRLSGIDFHNKNRFCRTAYASFGYFLHKGSAFSISVRDPFVAVLYIATASDTTYVLPPIYIRGMDEGLEAISPAAISLAAATAAVTSGMVTTYAR